MLSPDKKQFLVCEKNPENVTADYIMPGGQFEEANVEECLRAEVKEELDTSVDFFTLKFIGEYTDVAAGRPNRDVSIKLYSGTLTGKPKPSGEIEAIHWIGKDDASNPRVSPIIRKKIIPDLIARGLLL